jgi:hypothetical protein
MGPGKEGSERYPQAECLGVPLSLLSVRENLSGLSQWDNECRPNGVTAIVGGNKLDIWVELSSGKHALEQPWRDGVPDDGAAGCTGAGAEAQAAERVEASKSAGGGWGLCIGMGSEAPGAGSR